MNADSLPAKNSWRIIAALAMVVLFTIVPALVHGYYSNRWGAPADLSAAAERLASFPKTIGKWNYVSDLRELPPAVCEELGLAGYISRDYQNHATGETVSVLLMVGQPGKLLRHEPDVCYANRDNKQEGEAFETKVTPEDANKFRTLRYTSPSATGEKFTVTYGMKAEGSNWDVPYWRRFEFTGGSHLFKLQVLSTAPSASFERSVKTSKAFLSDFLPTFNQWLEGEQPKAAANPTSHS